MCTLHPPRQKRLHLPCASLLHSFSLETRSCTVAKYVASTSTENDDNLLTQATLTLSFFENSSCTAAMYAASSSTRKGCNLLAHAALTLSFWQPGQPLWPWSLPIASEKQALKEEQPKEGKLNKVCDIHSVRRREITAYYVMTSAARPATHSYGCAEESSLRLQNIT